MTPVPLQQERARSNLLNDERYVSSYNRQRFKSQRQPFVLSKEVRAPKFDQRQVPPLRPAVQTMISPQVNKKISGAHTLDLKECLASLRKIIPSPQRALARGHEQRSGNLMFNNIASMAGTPTDESVNPYISQQKHATGERPDFQAFHAAEKHGEPE